MPFGVDLAMELCVVVTAPLLAYAFFWRPLLFAIAIVRGDASITGRGTHFASLPLPSSGVEGWPTVSVHLPLHVEPWEVVGPTLMRAARAVARYNEHCGGGTRAARLHVSDDGLRLLLGSRIESVHARMEGLLAADESLDMEALARVIEVEAGPLTPAQAEGVQRLAYYVRHEVVVVARPAHVPGAYERRGEFPKASNLNETLRLDELTECPTRSDSQRWAGFFVSEPPRLGELILLIDKDSGTPSEIFVETVPEFVADPALAYTVHPTVVENAGEGMVTRLLSPGTVLYFNYWLPFTARSGMLFCAGHNTIVRKQALRDIGYWPEDRISEDYAACLRWVVRGPSGRRQRYRGRYLAFPNVVFSERVPARFSSFLAMARKYTAGTLQLFLNPLTRWHRSGVWTADGRAFLASASVTTREKLSAVLAIAPYLAIVPLVVVTVFTLHLTPADAATPLLVISAGVFAASNAPFWAAHWRARRCGTLPLGLEETSPSVMLRHAAAAFLFHMAAPFYLFGTAAGRLLGQVDHFLPTAAGTRAGATAQSLLRATLSGCGHIQLLGLVYAVQAALYLGWPESFAESARLVLCLQWGLCAALAPFVFDSHLHEALVARIRGGWSAPIRPERRRAFAIPHADALSVAALVGMALYLRTSGLEYNGPFLDESFYQVLGQRVATGGPFHYGFITSAPYIWPLIAHGVASVAGPTAPRVVTALLGAITVGLLYGIGRQAWLAWAPRERARHAHLAGMATAAAFAASASALWISRTARCDALAVMLLAAATQMVTAADRQTWRRRFAVACLLVAGFAANYSVLLGLPIVLGWALLQARSPKVRAHVWRELVAPCVFFLTAFVMLNHPFVVLALKHANASALAIPDVLRSPSSVVGEAASRELPLLIGTALAIAVLLGAIGGVRPAARREVIFCGTAAWLPVVYFAAAGHIFTMDRRLVTLELFTAPLFGFAATRFLVACMPAAATRASTVAAATAALLLLLEPRAGRLVAREEASYIDLTPVVDILEKETIPAMAAPVTVGYVSFDNVWYIKQRLENRFPGAVYVDERGPWAGPWLDRLRAGWRPDVIAGILVDRHLSAEAQHRAEQIALGTAAKAGYVVQRSLSVTDALFGDAAVAILVRARSRETRHGLFEGKQLLVTYNPTGEGGERSALASPETIRADLAILHAAGFEGLVTYGARGNLASIPAAARAQGFDGTIVMGVWDPTAADEINAAIDQAAHVDAYCVGNEGLGLRYSRRALAATMDTIRAATGRPVTTSERSDAYLGGRHGHWLFEEGDFVFPTTHPFWVGVQSPTEAVQWTQSVFWRLRASTSKQVLLKEVGLPSGGDSCCDEATQAAFYRNLERTDVAFAYFEAFDQPWKGPDPVERHWGLFRADRSPKPARPAPPAVKVGAASP
jgi:exo-beta-1,3-glucanase (GH17 family)/cellulose synthase/poly-beta-1,6-N-acetylglucosamine synthase-like glycosyltransferase